MRERVLRRRAEPQVVVHAGRHRLDRRAADGVAPLEAKAARHVDIADQAVAHLLHGFLQRRRRAALAALLHDAVVLAGRRDDLLRFEHIVRAGLLDVDVLAGLARPDGLQRVAVVGRGDRDRVDVLVFEQLAQIDDTLPGVSCRSFHSRPARLLQHALVDIADRRDFDVLHIAVSVDVALALCREDPTQATRTVSFGLDTRRGAALSGRRGTHKKMTSVHAELSLGG